MRLTREEKNKFIENIKSVLETGEPWEDDNLHYPADEAIRAILKIPGVKKVEDDGFVTNGWEWDWWQKFTYKGQCYTLSGSGYYGGHSFEKED